MKLLNYLVLFIAQLNFRIIALVVVPVVALVFTITDQALVRGTLREGGVFTALTDSAVEQSIASVPPAEQALVREGVTSVLDDTFTNDNGAVLLGSLYDWLEGKTVRPEFVIDVTAAKSEAINKTADAAEARVKALPVCTLEQLRALRPDMTLSDLTCQPAGLDFASERAKAISAAEQRTDIPSQVTSADLYKNAATAQAFEQLSFMPALYQVLRPLAWGLMIALVLFAVIIFLVQKPRSSALRMLGRTLLVVAILNALATVPLYLLATDSRLQGLDDTVRPLAGALLGLVREDFLRLYWLGTGLLALTGTGLVLQARRLKHDRPLNASTGAGKI